jgi:enoyl-CoA hydratase
MSEVLRETVSEGVAVIRLNRPERLNALSLSMRTSLAAAFHSMSDDESVRAVVITGDMRAFAAGADVEELATRQAIDANFTKARVAWIAMEAFPKPIIAAVNGLALGGGCELAMHCDIIIAGEGALFGQPEVKLGIMPGAGGTQRLLRAIGKFAAMRVLLTGDPMSAADALRVGLVSEVLPDADVLPHALKVAGRIATLAPLAVASIKEAVLAGEDVPLSTALALERKAFQLLFATEDRREGIEAFLAKRKAQFRGR